MEAAKTTFGRRLRLIRKGEGITLEELGRLASLGYKHIADIERGEKAPSFEAIDKLVKALKIPLHEFFLPAGAPEPKAVRSLKDLAREIDRNSSPNVRRCAASLLSQLSDLERELAADSKR